MPPLPDSRCPLSGKHYSIPHSSCPPHVIWTHHLWPSFHHVLRPPQELNRLRDRPPHFFSSCYKCRPISPAAAGKASVCCLLSESLPHTGSDRSFTGTEGPWACQGAEAKLSQDRATRRKMTMTARHEKLTSLQKPSKNCGTKAGRRRPAHACPAAAQAEGGDQETRGARAPLVASGVLPSKTECYQGR